MHRITLDILVAAPQDVTFTVFSDFANKAAIITAVERIEMLTDGPVGAGTRFRETRNLYGREAVEEMLVETFDPPSSFSLSAEAHGTRYAGVYRVMPMEGGTRVRMLFGAEPIVMGAKIMTWLLAPMVRRFKAHMEEMMMADLEDLRSYAEALARNTG